MFIYLLEFLPLILVGFIVGIFKGLQAEAKRAEKECYLNKWQVLKTTIFEGFAGSIICFIAYGLLSVVELPYIFKCCVGACIVFLGMDRALDMVDRFLRIRR